MLLNLKNTTLHWVAALCIALTLAVAVPVHAQDSSPEFIQAEIAQLVDEVNLLEARADGLEARAARLDARADRTRNQRRATRLRARADLLSDRATDISIEVLALQNQIAELELALAQGPDPEPEPQPAPQPDPAPQPAPADIEGISIADLNLSAAAQAILDANPNAESAINQRLIFTATNAQPTNTVLSQPNVDLRWRNNGDGNLIRLRPNSEQQFFFEQVRSADDHIGITLQSFSFFLVRGAVTFADFNAVRDELNAASLGLPPVNAPTGL